jgi:hypothetical protein
VVTGALVAGGGDGSLLNITGCCYFPDGAAFWRSEHGDSWVRSPTTNDRYDGFDAAAVIGFLHRDGALVADVSASPSRSAVSKDGGVTWTVTVHPRPSGPRAVAFPQAGQVLPVDGHAVARTAPTSECGDCTRGALALTRNGDRWVDVTPKFPCGMKQTRPNYGFISRPTAVGDAVAVLAGCGENLQPFNETLLAVSADGGTHWQLERMIKVGTTPLAGVAGHGRIVTLALQGADENSGRIRVITVST